MNISVRGLANDLLDFFLPSHCTACERILVHGEDILCLSCIISLPYTGYAGEPSNPVVKQFWGKVPVENAMSLLHFTKGERVQRLLHKLKYRDRPEIGIKLGRLCAGQLISSGLFSAVDYIIPVPLHERKQRRRGYNQSERFAYGLSEGLDLPYLADGLVRLKNTGTQTRKSRYDRSGNVADVFAVGNGVQLHDASILLVDDVITTGSTLGACAEVLFLAGAKKVSIAAIAYANT